MKINSLKGDGLPFVIEGQVSQVKMEKDAAQGQEVTLSPAEEEVAKALEKLNIDLSPREIKVVAKLLADQAISLPELAEAIKAIEVRGLPLTAPVIEAVHQVLTKDHPGPVLVEALEEVFGTQEWTDLAFEVEEAPVIKEPSLPVMDQESPKEEKTPDLPKVDQALTHDKELVVKEDLELADPLQLLEKELSGLVEELESRLSLPPTHVQFIERVITPAMIQLQEEFQAVKQEVLSKLQEEIRPLLEQASLPSKQQVKQVQQGMFEVIDKLDQLITKHEIGLYSDMKFEKKLLLGSSKLETARSLLQEGQVDKALPLVKEVESLVTKLTFTPKKERIFNRAFLPPKDSFQLDLASPRVRDKVEVLRRLGINHDVELGADKALKLPLKEINLKEVLLTKEEKGTLTGQEAKVLQTLQGSQLLTRVNPKGEAQQIQLQLPIYYEGKIQEVKLYINTKKNQDEKLDWQNASLYFMIDLGAKGYLGVKVTNKAANALVTFETDNIMLRKGLSAAKDQIKEELKGIGYQVKGLYFTGLSQVKEEKQEPKPVKRAPTQKGFDLSI